MEKVNTVIHGDCIKVLQELEENSIDAVVSDPPYGLGFMGKSWDNFSPKEYQDFCYNWGKEILRVLKPGGYCLAFSGTRTYHRMVVGLEDAGFKIKDMINWLYGSGFPKSYNISKGIDKSLGINHPSGKLISINTAMSGGNYSRENKKEVKTIKVKEWEGWGTASKPAHEPIVVAQKTLDGNYVENILKYNIGGLNIDDCRINYTPDKETDNRIGTNEEWHGKREASEHTVSLPAVEGMQMYKNKGRWPSNVILSHHPECKIEGIKKVGNGKAKHNSQIKRQGFKYDGPFNKISSGFDVNKCQGLGEYGSEIKPNYICHPDCPIRLLDEQSGDIKTHHNPDQIYHYDKDKKNEHFFCGNWDLENTYNDNGGASRFFYCAKAHKSERNAGLEDLSDEYISDGRKVKADFPKQRNRRAKKNNIATLKPINIMRYLVKLVCPKGGIILDPFAGSGTTGIACIIEGMNYILIEKRRKFAEDIIPKRLEYWKDPKHWEVLNDHNSLQKIKKLKTEKVNKSLEKWII